MRKNRKVKRRWFVDFKDEVEAELLAVFKTVLEADHENG